MEGAHFKDAGHVYSDSFWISVAACVANRSLPPQAGARFVGFDTSPCRSGNKVCGFSISIGSGEYWRSFQRCGAGFVSQDFKGFYGIWARCASPIFYLELRSSLRCGACYSDRFWISFAACVANRSLPPQWLALVL